MKKRIEEVGRWHVPDATRQISGFENIFYAVSKIIDGNKETFEELSALLEKSENLPSFEVYEQEWKAKEDMEKALNHYLDNVSALNQTLVNTIKKIYHS